MNFPFPVFFHDGALLRRKKIRINMKQIPHHLLRRLFLTRGPGLIRKPPERFRNTVFSLKFEKFRSGGSQPGNGNFILLQINFCKGKHGKGLEIILCDDSRLHKITLRHFSAQAVHPVLCFGDRRDRLKFRVLKRFRPTSGKQEKEKKRKKFSGTFQMI